MSLEDAILNREISLYSLLKEKQSGIEDSTGKGLAAENLVEKELITPFLPPRFGCIKGSVINSSDPSKQSYAVDRIIYDKTVAPPLVYEPSHSIFPIECVCGLVEITLRLDKTKLRKDIEKMVPLKGIIKRNLTESVPETKTKIRYVVGEFPSPRSFIIGMAANDEWQAETIAAALRDIQKELGPPTHVHGLYVIGIGYFETETVEPPEEPTYRVLGVKGKDRLFRFTDSLRRAFERWPRLPEDKSAHLSEYVKISEKIKIE